MLFLDDSAQKAALVASAEASGLTNVMFLDTVPEQEAAQYWSQLDVAIIHCRRTGLFKAVISFKLTEYLAIGIPIRHGIVDDSAKIIQREHAGQLFVFEYASELADEVLDLRDDTELRPAFTNNGPIAAKRYGRNTLAEPMHGTLLGVVDR